jgi:hypothetical protein
VPAGRVVGIDNGVRSRLAHTATNTRPDTPSLWTEVAAGILTFESSVAEMLCATRAEPTRPCASPTTSSRWHVPAITMDPVSSTRPSLPAGYRQCAWS